MKDFIQLTDLDLSFIHNVFSLADRIHKETDVLKGKCIVLFFPNSSIRTRITFEKGITLLGGHPVLFPSDSLDKKESIEDVVGYLNNWADGIVVRHNSIKLIKEIAGLSKIPVINAMTNENHPCEILTDLYSISKLRENFINMQYTFIGRKGNIGNTWFEAAQAFGLKFRQFCPKDKNYEIEGANILYDFDEALCGSDIILTDSYPADILIDFLPYQITIDAMRKANKNALLNPCPPFFRGEEVSNDVINSPFFVGYQFKESLLAIQQALITYLLCPADRILRLC